MEQRTNWFAEVFNVRDLRAVEALLGTSMTRWAELMTEIEYSSGSAAEMADERMDNLAGDIEYLKSALSEARITISDKLTPTLRRFTQKGIEWVNRLTNAFKAGGFKGALKEVGALFRESVTDWLNVGKDASWGEIGKPPLLKLKMVFLVLVSPSRNCSSAILIRMARHGLMWRTISKRLLTERSKRAVYLIQCSGMPGKKRRQC